MRPKFKNEQYEKAYGLYKQGYSLQKIASLLNLSRQAIWEGFTRRGYKLRQYANKHTHIIFQGVKFAPTKEKYLTSTANKGRTRMHRFVWEYYNSMIPKGYVVHHINGDRADNNIANLKLLTMKEHTILHHKGRKYKK